MLVVGQVPPPVNGQSLMIREFLAGSYPGIQLVHVPLNFSRTTAEVGAFDFRKLWVLLTTLFSIVRARVRTGATVLYYPPASPNMVPVLRDLMLLGSTRWLFEKTAFHFHAAGLANIYPRLPRLLRPFFHLAYDKPDLAIFTTAATSAEAEFLGAKFRAIVACGVEDMAADWDVGQRRGDDEGATILFAGILCEGKGVLVLLEACGLLRKAGLRFKLVCIGAFDTDSFRRMAEQAVHDHGLDGMVSFPGIVVGEKKTACFRSANIFCFPSHYAAESFGVVLIEAMSFSLPIVATRWQGIPEVALDGAGSFLVEVKRPAAVAARLTELLESPALRESMGHQNRLRYLEKFTLCRYRSGMVDALSSLRTLP